MNPESNGASVAQDAPPTQELSDIRARHHQKYREREEELQRQEEELKSEEARRADEDFAKKLAEDAEEERLREELEADEEFARQLAAQLNPGGGSHPLQDFGSGDDRINGLPGQDFDDAAAHRGFDSEGYRAPMRTGYTDRLIDDAPGGDDFAEFDFAQLLSEDEGASGLIPNRGQQAQARSRRNRRWTALLVPAAGVVLLLAGVAWFMATEGGGIAVLVDSDRERLGGDLSPARQKSLDDASHKAFTDALPWSEQAADSPANGTEANSSTDASPAMVAMPPVMATEPAVDRVEVVS